MKKPSDKLESYRETSGPFATSRGDLHGKFWIPAGYGDLQLQVISSGDLDPNWEHVSVSLPKRCPNWPEMCKVKNYFWDENETVVQFHPPRSEYVNNHPHCLHLWRSKRHVHVLPDSMLVGLKGVNVDKN